MGTTSEKLTYLNTTKGLIKDNLNLGGANISTEPFRAYSSKLKGIYKDFLANGTDTLWNNWEKVSGSGETLSLTPTIKGKMKIDLKGNTYQEQTTQSKNLFDSIKGENGYVDNNGDVVYRTIQFASDYIKIDKNQDYTISVNQSANTIGVAYFDENKTIILPRVDNNNVSSAIANSSTATYIRFWINLNGSTSLNATNIAETYHAQMEKGSSATSYVPFVPNSPSPDYPQDIQVVSGDNSIKVEGKNLFDKSAVTSNKIVNRSDGTLNSNNGYKVTDYIKVKANVTYYQSHCNNYYSVYYDKSKNYLGVCGSAKFTPTQDGYIRTSIANADINIAQVEVGESASEYTPYVSQTYPINLGNIELCKIGDYQDKIVKDNGSWYLHKEVGKVVLNGSEPIAIPGTAVGTGLTAFRVTPSNINYIAEYCKAYSNQFQFTARNFNAWNVTEKNTPYTAVLALSGTIKCFYCRVESSLASDVATFRNLLANNNVEVYFPLATPTYTEITDSTLIGQLNDLEKAKSYNEQTNVSQVNNDLAFILDLTALKEM